MLKTTKTLSSRMKKYDISIEDVSKAFNYSSPESFRSSSAYNRYLKGVDRIIQLIELQLINKLEE